MTQRHATRHANDAGTTDGRQDIARAGIAMSAGETVQRFGGSNAEYIKGYRGIDNETGRRFAKGLAGIAQHKVSADPQEAIKNIKQQAGYAAEVAATSRDNADAIVRGSKVRTSRSDDLPQYGKNHSVVDRVQILGGQIIEGSQSQMKFVGNRDQLFERIATEDGKFARYRGMKLELPTEQFEGASDFCRDKADALRKQAARLESDGKADVAAQLKQKARHYEQLSTDVRDSGLTTEQAIFYREHPALATARDIGRTSHRAGIEGARYGAAIGGCISLLQNLFALARADKDVYAAAQDIAMDVGKAGALGYGTAAIGATLKACLQQSGHQVTRGLARTSAPALAVNICLSIGSSVQRYVAGQIDEAQLLAEVGEKGAGMLSSGMMAAVGQVAIPVPVVGAAIGGMVGYALSSIFYQSALDASREADLSRQQLQRAQAIASAAQTRIAEEQAALEAFTTRELPALRDETRQLFAVVDATTAGTADALAAAINQYANLLGKQLPFGSQAEFDDFMQSDRPLCL